MSLRLLQPTCEPLVPDDSLPQHCLRNVVQGRYFDEHGTELSGRSNRWMVEKVAQ